MKHLFIHQKQTMKQLLLISFTTIVVFFSSCQQDSTINPSFPTNKDAYYGDWTCTHVERDTTVNGNWFTEMSSPNGVASYNLRINATAFESESGLAITGGGTIPNPVYWDETPSYSFDSNAPAFVKMNETSMIDTLGNFVSFDQTRKFKVVQFEEFATPHLSTMKLVFTYTLTDTNGVNIPASYQERFSYERPI